jgi:hypothetical protein
MAIRRNGNNPVCPLCRRPDTTEGQSCPEMNEIVKRTVRQRDCGNLVSDVNLRDHESTCAVCWKICVDAIQTELKNVLATVLMKSAELEVEKRRNKRKIDECDELKRSNDDLRRILSHNEQREARRRRRFFNQ